MFHDLNLHLFYMICHDPQDQTGSTQKDGAFRRPGISFISVVFPAPLTPGSPQLSPSEIRKLQL